MATAPARPSPVDSVRRVLRQGKSLAQRRRLTTLNVALTQGENRIPVFALTEGGSIDIVPSGENRFRFTHSIGKRHHPELVEGPVVIEVTAGQPTLF